MSDFVIRWLYFNNLLTCAAGICHQGLPRGNCKTAARAVFPMHANLDEKIKEKFGRGVRGVTEKNLSEASNATK